MAYGMFLLPLHQTVHKLLLFYAAGRGQQSVPFKFSFFRYNWQFKTTHRLTIFLLHELHLLGRSCAFYCISNFYSKRTTHLWIDGVQKQVDLVTCRICIRTWYTADDEDKTIKHSKDFYERTHPEFGQFRQHWIGRKIARRWKGFRLCRNFVVSRR